MQKEINRVDVENSCKIIIWSEKSASTQKRTSFSTFGGKVFIFFQLCPSWLEGLEGLKGSDGFDGLDGLDGFEEFEEAVS